MFIIREGKEPFDKNTLSHIYKSIINDSAYKSTEILINPLSLVSREFLRLLDVRYLENQQ